MKTKLLLLAVMLLAAGFTEFASAASLREIVADLTGALKKGTAVKFEVGDSAQGWHLTARSKAQGVQMAYTAEMPDAYDAAIDTRTSYESAENYSKRVKTAVEARKAAQKTAFANGAIVLTLSHKIDAELAQRSSAELTQGFFAHSDTLVRKVLVDAGVSDSAELVYMPGWPRAGKVVTRDGQMFIEFDISLSPDLNAQVLEKILRSLI